MIKFIRHNDRIQCTRKILLETCVIACRREEQVCTANIINIVSTLHCALCYYSVIVCGDSLVVTTFKSNFTWL